MSQAFSSSRPLHGDAAQTPMYQKMSEYAYKPEVQEIMQKLLADIFTERPELPLDYMIEWMMKERRRRELNAFDSSTSRN